MSVAELKQQLEQAKAKAYKLKTKKAQAKAWDRVREIRREIINTQAAI